MVRNTCKTGITEEQSHELVGNIGLGGDDWCLVFEMEWSVPRYVKLLQIQLKLLNYASPVQVAIVTVPSKTRVYPVD